MRVEVYVDGASRGNPGPAGIGVVISSEGREVRKFKQFIGHATNNEAEYRALLAALKLAREMGARSVVVKSDSELLVKQLRGEYKVRKKSLALLYDKALRELGNFEEFEIRHISREENKTADRLANEAIDESLK